MTEHSKSAKKLWARILIIALGLLFAVSVGVNVYLLFWEYDSYLQSKDEIYTMEAGILRNNLEFVDGEDYKLTYDFDNSEYSRLIEIYGIDQTSGEGSEFEKALRLMNEYAPRLSHNGNYDNSVEIEALPLLEYSLDNKSHGINCRGKAQILNEMCLALGIYSRKVWIVPNSGYDNECHVVNEVWDETLNKWVMLDITNNEYWVDENGAPLSILEIRYKGAMQEFCTPVKPGDELENLEKLKEKYISDFIYIMKNMAYTEYCGNYTVGESDTIYLLFPKSISTDYKLLISKEACERPPME